MDEVYEKVYISNRRKACETDKSDIDMVITVCQDGIEENVSCKYYHFLLEDGNHDKKRFEKAVEKTLQGIEENKTILVHCHEGISRSPSVVATALSLYLDIGVREALSKIKERREMVSPAPQLVDSAMDIGNKEIPFNN